MRSVTVNQVMAWGPCGRYPRERIERLFRGRDRLTVLDVCDLHIGAEDRVWAVSQMLTAHECRRLCAGQWSTFFPLVFYTYGAKDSHNYSGDLRAVRALCRKQAAKKAKAKR